MSIEVRADQEKYPPKYCLECGALFFCGDQSYEKSNWPRRNYCRSACRAAAHVKVTRARRKGQLPPAPKPLVSKLGYVPEGATLSLREQLVGAIELHPEFGVALAGGWLTPSGDDDRRRLMDSAFSRAAK